MKLIALATTMLLSASAFAAYYPPAKTQKIIERYEVLNDKCRDGSGDDPHTIAACEKRDVLYQQIKIKHKWCWGSYNQDAYGYQKEWLQCKYDKS
jgi:hypothetical protein